MTTHAQPSTDDVTGAGTRRNKRVLRVAFMLNLDQYPELEYLMNLTGHGALPREIQRLAAYGAKAIEANERIIRAAQERLIHQMATPAEPGSIDAPTSPVPTLSPGPVPGRNEPASTGLAQQGSVLQASHPVPPADTPVQKTQDTKPSQTASGKKAAGPSAQRANLTGFLS